VKIHEPNHRAFNETPTWEFPYPCRCGDSVLVRINAWNPPNEFRVETVHHEKRNRFNSADLQIRDVLSSICHVMRPDGVCGWAWDREVHMLICGVSL
jgi:hypothetical protein